MKYADLLAIARSDFNTALCLAWCFLLFPAFPALILSKNKLIMFKRHLIYFYFQPGTQLSRIHA